jgi:hypothetical protein
LRLEKNEVIAPSLLVPLESAFYTETGFSFDRSLEKKQKVSSPNQEHRVEIFYLCIINTELSFVVNMGNPDLFALADSLET